MQTTQLIASVIVALASYFRLNKFELGFNQPAARPPPSQAHTAIFFGLFQIFLMRHVCVCVRRLAFAVLICIVLYLFVSNACALRMPCKHIPIVR